MIPTFPHGENKKRIATRWAKSCNSVSPEAKGEVVAPASEPRGATPAGAFVVATITRWSALPASPQRSRCRRWTSTLADVRYGSHYGLVADIAPLPRRASRRHPTPHLITSSSVASVALRLFTPDSHRTANLARGSSKKM